MMSQDQINELTRAVGRIEGKLDGVLEDRQSLRARVGTLERWRAYTSGAITVLGILVGALWKVIHG